MPVTLFPVNIRKGTLSLQYTPLILTVINVNNASKFGLVTLKTTFIQSEKFPQTGQIHKIEK